jgi:surfactin synthase thioesterase subunit
MPADTELLVAQLPAREARLTEAPLPELGALADGLAAAIRALPPRPAVLLGHSMGALLAYEVAHRLTPWPAPLALAVAGREAPDVPMLGHHAFLDLPDDAFVTEISDRYGGIPAAVLQEPELLALVTPGLRADFRAVAGYREVARRPLPHPLLVLHGTTDALTAPGRIEGWCERTTGPARILAFDGGHFFLNDHAADIVGVCLAMLSAAGSGAISTQARFQNKNLLDK